MKQLWMGRHKSGELEEGEETRRAHIVGMPRSVPKEKMLWNKYTQGGLYRESTTAIFISEANDTRGESSGGGTAAKGADMAENEVAARGMGVTAGPFVTEPDIHGQYSLLMPGTMWTEEAVDELLRIEAPTMGKSIMNVRHPNGMHLRLLAKNHSKFFKNVITCYRGEGELEPMMIRSRGGAAEVAGANQMDSSSKYVHRGSPNLTLSNSQKISDAVSLGFCELVQHRQLVNIFMTGMYCGAWVAKEVRYGYLDNDDLWDECDAFNELLGRLHDREEDEKFLEWLNLKSRTIDETMEHHLQSMASAGVWLVLEPLDPNILQKWRGCPDTVVPWKVLRVYERDMVVPSMGFSSSEEAKRVCGATRDKPFNGWDSFLRISPLSCIGEVARIECGIADDGGEALRRGHRASLVPMDREAGGKMSLSDVQNLFLHAQGMTSVKMCSNGVVAVPTEKAKLGTIYPPREFLGKISQDAKNSLKPLSTRPVHPGALNLDPVPHLCAVATGCFSGSRGEGGDSETGRVRWGSQWVQKNREQAWSIMFKCVVGCVTQSTVLLQLWNEDETHKDDVCRLMPGPHENDLESFRNRVQEYEWMSRLVHPIFRKTLLTSEIYFRFLRGVLSPVGMSAFMDAVMIGERGRYGKLIALKGRINDICQVDLSEFQVQTIFRTIECCINEPFGPVDEVPTGPGGELGAKCLLKCYKDSPFSKEENPNVGTKTRPAKMKENLADRKKIPFWLVHEFNQRVKGIMDSQNEKRINQLKDELKVCFLDWNNVEECLYHTLGIRRRFNASDTEHLLCLLSTCHQFTLSARNCGSSNDLDCEKHHPIRFDSKERLARDLPFMTMMTRLFGEVEAAYIRLLEDSSYEFSRLADVFRIDNDGATDNEQQTMNNGQ